MSYHPTTTGKDEEATQKRKAFLAHVRETIDTATKLKKVMTKKGIRQARCVCPKCGGFIHGRIAGPRNHLHMACETAGCLRMME